MSHRSLLAWLLGLMVSLTAVPQAHARDAPAKATGAAFSAAIEAAEKIADAGRRARLFADISAAQTRAGLADEAAATARRAGDLLPTVGGAEAAYARQSLVAAQILQSDWDAALRTARAIPVPEVRLAVLGRIAHAEADVGFKEAAIRTVELLESEAASPQNYWSISSADYSVDALVEAAEIEKQLGRSAAGERTFQHALAAVVRREEGRDGLQVLSAYMCVAAGRIHTGEREEALRVLERAVGFVRDPTLPGPPDENEHRDDPVDRVVSLCRIAELQASAGSAPVAAETLKEAARAVAMEAGGSAGLEEPGRVSIAESLARIGRAEEAIETARRLTVPSNRARACLAVAQALIDGGHPESAARLLNEPAATSGLSPEADFDVLVEMAETWGKAGDSRAALDMLRRAGAAVTGLPSVRARAEARNRVARADIRIGARREAAHAVLANYADARSVTDYGISGNCASSFRELPLILMGRLQCEAGDFFHAWQTFRCAPQGRPRNEIACAIARNLGHARRFREASDAAEQIQDEADRAEAFLSIAVARAEERR